MAGVHGLKHVESFFAAALTETDAVGSHAKRVLDQIALLQLALPFDVGWTRFHAGHVWLLQLQFSRLAGAFKLDFRIAYLLPPVLMLGISAWLFRRRSS